MSPVDTDRSHLSHDLATGLLVERPASASRSEPGSARPRRACGGPPHVPTEALPYGRQHRSKQDPADNTGDDEREERGHAAVLQKADEDIDHKSDQEPKYWAQ